MYREQKDDRCSVFNYGQIPTLILCRGDSVQAGKQEHKPK